MCGVRLSIIILVLALFKFPVTLNSFTRLPSCTKFISGTVSYCSSSCYCSPSFSSSLASFSTLSLNLSRSYPILCIILLYNKEVVSHLLCSLSASASRIAATGADTALYNFEIVFLIQLVVFIIDSFFGSLQQALVYEQKI